MTVIDRARAALVRLRQTRLGSRRALGLGSNLVPSRHDRVVVLADGTLRTSVLEPYLTELVDGSEVTILGGAITPSLYPGVHLAPSAGHPDDVTWLVRNGPVDVVIDLRHPRLKSRRTRWARLFPYLREGGVWLVPRQDSAGDLRVTEREWLAALSGVPAQDLTPTSRALAEESRRSIAQITVRASVVRITKRLVHVVKLRDDEITSALPRRDPQVDVDVIMTLPATTFESAATIVSHESAVPVGGLDTTIAVPQMSVRHYRGPVTFAGQTLMYTENSVLADSFRFYHALDEVRGRLANRNLYDFDARLSRVRPEKVATTSLAGDYYQVDPQTTGHFGHIMTEMIARLWGWDAAKERLPELKALLWVRPRPAGLEQSDTAERGARLERRLLTAFGIADEDIVLVDQPTRLESLVSATMQWHNWTPYFVHPAITETWRRIADNVIEPNATVYERIFISRSEGQWRRTCENKDAVEAFFVEHGFTIVYPELHDLGVQAALFANATTIAGFGGSALFNLMYAKRVQTVILLNQEGYTARNEHLYTAALGCEVHYFWSTPVHTQPPAGWSLGAYQSEWEFDFARNERALAELLDSL